MPGIYPEAVGQAKNIGDTNPPNPARGPELEQVDGEGPQPENLDTLPQPAAHGGCGWVGEGEWDVPDLVCRVAAG